MFNSGETFGNILIEICPAILPIVPKEILPKCSKGV